MVVNSPDKSNVVKRVVAVPLYLTISTYPLPPDLLDTIISLYPSPSISYINPDSITCVTVTASIIPKKESGEEL